jgi:hypothetical protein
MNVMPPYRIVCYTPGCGQDAAYKIAARWSDGATEELKTYACSCETCLPQWYRQSCSRQKACRLTAGETLERPGIFKLQRGKRDREIGRLTDLEKSLSS